MEIFDITLPITPDLPVWPGDPPVVLEQVESMDAGAHANVSHISLSVHTGTHVDAPHHFLNDNRTVESLSLDALNGPAWVIRIPDEEQLITSAVLAGANIPSGTERILLKTSNSALWGRGQKEFFPGFVGISAEGAGWLVRHNVRLIGIDYLSVAPYKNSVPTHRILLEAGMIILEGVDLSHVDPGSYDLFCLPLKLVGSDGAPARAILVK
jgi:arylformamidase